MLEVQRRGAVPDSVPGWCLLSLVQIRILSMCPINRYRCSAFDTYGALMYKHVPRARVLQVTTAAGLVAPNGSNNDVASGLVQGPVGAANLCVPGICDLLSQVNLRPSLLPA